MEKSRINNTFKSKVMKAAWTTFRKSDKSFSKCLKSAWKWAKRTLHTVATSISSTIKSIERETAKALLVNARLVCVHTDQVVSVKVWMPKSVVTDNVVAEWFFSKKQNELREEYSHYSGGTSLILEF